MFLNLEKLIYITIDTYQSKLNLIQQRMRWLSRLELQNTTIASCRGVRLSQWVSCLWHKTIWWWDSSNAGALRMRSTPLLPSLPSQSWHGVVAPDRVLSMGQIELNCVLTLNWVVWNRTVDTYKMDLALKIYNVWYAIKPKQSKQNEDDGFRKIVWYQFSKRVIFRINIQNEIFYFQINLLFLKTSVWTPSICLGPLLRSPLWKHQNCY